MSETTIGWTGTVVSRMIATANGWLPKLKENGRLPGFKGARILPNGDALLPGMTLNLWWGCVETGPGCDNCYARVFAQADGYDVWGKDLPRRFLGDAKWEKPLAWNRKAQSLGVQLKVFLGSMMDIAEYYERRETAVTKRMDAERQRMWPIMEQTMHLTWLMLTKRPHNIPKIVPPHWLNGRWPRNVWLGTTAENQQMADVRLSHLLKLPAPVRFISHEPALEKVDFRPHLHGIHWLITGGESGDKSRPYSPPVALDVVEQGREFDVPVYVKQMGSVWARQQHIDGFDKKGEDMQHWPDVVRVREWPEVTVFQPSLF